MATADVDAYLSGLEEPKRGTLQTLRRTILEIVPEAEQVISYRVPAFRMRRRTVAGFAAFRDHLSYLPFSGSVLTQLTDELATTQDEERPSLPGRPAASRDAREKLIAVRLAEDR